MTADIHTCSYYCERPECVRRQRDELRDRLEAVLAKQPPSAPVGANVRKAGEVSPYSDVVLVADLAQQPAAVDMAADVELLPLLDSGPYYGPGDMQEYARACVAHATAAKDAEIEALLAEVEMLRADRDSWEQQASDRVADWHAEHLRAERLRAEVAAWRELSDHVRVGACAAIWPDRYTDARTRDVAAALKRAARMEEALALLPDEIVMVEHNPYEGPLMFCCGQRVTLSWHHGLEPTHGKECWYARMRALRDHDQEDRND